MERSAGIQSRGTTHQSLGKVWLYIQLSTRLSEKCTESTGFISPVCGEYLSLLPIDDDIASLAPGQPSITDNKKNDALKAREIVTSLKLVCQSILQLPV